MNQSGRTALKYNIGRLALAQDMPLPDFKGMTNRKLRLIGRGLGISIKPERKPKRKTWQGKGKAK